MSGFQGAQQSATALHPQAVTDFHIKSSQAKMWTSTLVKVVSVTNSGGLSPSGTVDIMPLVNQIDGAGNAQPHGVIHAELRRTCGGPQLPQATADQIQARIDMIRRWAISGR